MTTIVVVGSSRAGKTKFMHMAITGHAPLNIYKSTAPETFELQGCYGLSASLIVLPGSVGQEELREHMQLADGLMVVYSGAPHAAREWLLRCTNGKRTSLPIMVCRHDDPTAASPAHLAALLRQWPSAEHTCTSTQRAVGLKDCVNRIVYRSKSELGSPVT